MSTYYRCENEYGLDPCELAKANQKIAQADVASGTARGVPRCPGKTVSGATCGSELIALEAGKSSGRRRLRFVGLAAGVVLVVLLLSWIWPGGGAAILRVSPDPIVFPAVGSGPTTATVRLRNTGDAELLVSSIEASPAMFTVATSELRIPPDQVEEVSIRFNAPSDGTVDGELVVHSNSDNSPTSVRLVGNRDPWWTYGRLESSSELLTKAP